MPFTVGQYLTANDLKSQEDAHTLGYGVVNGLKVIPTDPVSMTVQVEIGKAYAADTLVVKGAVTDLTVGAADPTNPRKDIVVCDSAGTLSIVAGTAETALPSGNVGVYTLNPEPPSIPANSIILAEIWVPAGATEITGSEIYDKRVFTVDRLGKARLEWAVNKILKGAGAGSDPTEIDVPVGGGLAIFGDGSDGDIETAGGGAGDVTLSRDMFYNSLIVTAGDTITTAGYRIFVKGTLTNNGTIERNGTSATSTSGKAGLSAANLGSSGYGGNGIKQAVQPGIGGGGGSGGGVILIAAKTIVNTSGVISANGGDGHTGSTSGSGTNVPPNAGEDQNPSLGGAGGAGGQSGASGGSVTAPKSSYRATPMSTLAWDTSGDAFLVIDGGGGGGGGQRISNGGGGGGGAGGGCLILIYQSASWGTEQVNGGSGAAGVGGAGAGEDGSVGTVIKIANV